MSNLIGELSLGLGIVIGAVVTNLLWYFFHANKQRLIARCPGMVMSWTKSQDWIPYQNALDQVNYYLDSIVSSERSLAIMDMMGVPHMDLGYLKTVEEIARKQKLLEIARYKVKRSFLRITESDKEAWKDKLPF